MVVVMSSPRVRLGIPPHLADLELWGRDVGGEWWALVVWSVQVTPPDGSHPVPTGCVAWVPGVEVEQPRRAVEYRQVRRMQLPAEPAEWPAPVDRPRTIPRVLPRCARRWRAAATSRGRQGVGDEAGRRLRLTRGRGHVDGRALCNPPLRLGAP